MTLKNPGPIDQTRTIQASYSQDNVELFAQNVGPQCVAMSLTELISMQVACFSTILDLILKTKSSKYYLTIFHSDGTLDECQTVNDTKFRLHAFANTVTEISSNNDSEVAYSIRFLHCYNNLSSSLKQKVFRKRKPNLQKKSTCREKKKKVMKKWNLLPNENT